MHTFYQINSNSRIGEHGLHVSKFKFESRFRVHMGIKVPSGCTIYAKKLATEAMPWTSVFGNSSCRRSLCCRISFGLIRLLNTVCSLVGFSDGCSVIDVCKQLLFSENSWRISSTWVAFILGDRLILQNMMYIFVTCLYICSCYWCLDWMSCCLWTSLLQSHWNTLVSLH